MESPARSGFDFQVSADLFNALPHPGKAIAEAQVLDTSAVITGTDFHTICRLDRLDPQILRSGMPHGIGNDLLDAAKDGLRANGMPHNTIVPMFCCVL